MIFELIAGAGGGNDSAGIFGTITTPQGVSAFDSQSGTGFGLVFFISSLIRIGTIAAGLWVFFNIITAGITFISAGGDASVPDKAKDKILHSVIGLALIVFSYVIIALISFILFQDPLYILNPKIIGPAGA